MCNSHRKLIIQFMLPLIANQLFIEEVYSVLTGNRNEVQSPLTNPLTIGQ